jgi:hypothetical protein
VLERVRLLDSAVNDLSEQPGPVLVPLSTSLRTQVRAAVERDLAAAAIAEDVELRLLPPLPRGREAIVARGRVRCQSL